MPHLVENVKDINDFKYLRKLFVRIRYLWCVTSISNKDHLKMVLMDAKCDMVQIIVPPYLVQKHKVYSYHVNGVVHEIIQTQVTPSNNKTKAGEDNLLAYQYAFDKMLKKELVI
ncbi:hypothetical protein KIW84_061964 [Lathyrus oleraceus]|uniref:Uncharacterized protein n=1 Tax=Pisum sativum TaxID=3888 RepID=A0A9D5A572_PEA|nr:hypothetical protein KIW84_061964 [Pisum sativum]